MGAPKSIDLGDGLRREVSYEELKSLLAKHGGIYNPQSWDLLQRLFPVELESERWGCYLETKVKGAPLFPYRYTHKDIVQMARRPRRNARKGLPQNRVTDFTRWIYDVIYESPPNPASLLDGKNRERDVAEKKQLPRLNGRSEWEKIYCDPLDEKPEALVRSTTSAMRFIVAITWASLVTP